MLLTSAERQKFAEFCKTQAESSNAIITQMEKLPGVIPDMIKREKSKAAAFSIVAEDLISREEFTI